MERNLLLDVTKCIAILFVILSHSIQFGSGLPEKEVLNLPIECFFISFFMPLFAMVSGYLFYHSLQRHDERTIIFKRLRLFLWPIVTMAILHNARPYLIHLDFVGFVCNFPKALFNSLWFFWAILVCTILMCIVHKWLGDSWWGHVLIIIFTLLLPDIYPLRAYVYLLPYFIVAYNYAKYQKTDSFCGGAHPVYIKLLGLLLLGILFFSILSHFSKEDMIYFSRYSLLGSVNLLEDIYRDLFRFFIGVVGSIMIILLLSIILQLKLLHGQLLSKIKDIGSNTFGLYVFQDFMLLLLVPFFRKMSTGNLVVSSLLSFIVLYIGATLLLYVSKKNKILSLIFLGKK